MHWVLIKTFLIASSLITNTFLAFFIWQIKQDIQLVLIYGLIYFLVAPIAALIGGILTDKISPKFSLVLGTWMQIAQIVLLLINKTLDTNEIMIIAAIGGLGYGLITTPTYVLDYIERDRKDEASIFYANRTFITRILQLIIPLTAAFLVSQSNGFNLLFRATAIIILMASVLIFLFKNEYVKNKFELANILKFPGTNADKFTLVKGVFFEGLSEGFNFTVFPIIILIFVGNILNWAILNTSLVLVAITITYLVKRYVNDVNSKLIYSVAAFLFAFASLFLISGINFYIIMIFLLAKTFMELVKEISYFSAVDNIIDEDRREYELYAEYQFLVELATSIGRIIPIVALLLINVNIENPFTIVLILLVIGFIPMTTLSFLSKSAIFSPTYKEENTIGTIRAENTPKLS